MTVPRAQTLLRQVSGVWAAQVLTIMAQAVYFAISSRLLTTDDFGAYAAALSVLAVWGMVANAGLSNASARSDNTSLAARRALVSAGLVTSLAAALVVALGAPLWANIWGQPESENLVRLLALTLPWANWSGILGGYLRRDGRLTAYAWATVLGAVTGLAFGLWALTSWRSAEALTVMPIAVPLVTTAAMIAALGNQALPISRPRGIRQDIGFGAKSWGVWLVALASNTLPIVGLGRVLGATTLGEWNRAQTITRLPWDNTMRSLNTVTYPLFRNPVPGNPETINHWTAASSAIGLFAIPMALIPLPAVPDLVAVVLGPQWTQSGQIAPWLWVAAAIWGMSFLLGSALESAGYFSGIFKAQVAALAVIVIGVTGMWAGDSWLVLAIALIASTGVALAVQIMTASSGALIRAKNLLGWYALALLTGSVLMATTWLLCLLVETHIARLVVAAVVALLYVGALVLLRRHVGPLQQLLGEGAAS